MSQRVVLAYLGDLNTSCILKWLLEKGYEVICYMANLGQDENFDEAYAKALKIGASKVIIEDLRSDFVENYFWPSIKHGLIYENRYLLGISIARPCIAVGLTKCARENGVQYISHGAPGRVDQLIRLELNAHCVWPEAKILTPWRTKDFIEMFQEPQDLLKYGQENEIPVSVNPKAPGSMNANRMHTSIESGILEDPKKKPPKDLSLMTPSPEKILRGSDEFPNLHLRFSLEFKSGLPVSLKIKTAQNKNIIKGPLEIFTELNKIGSEFGVGQINIVENSSRFIGMKSRNVYETPGGYILYKAHEDVELFCMDKEIYRIKQDLSGSLSRYVYDGFWFFPVANYIRKCINVFEEEVNGIIKMKITPGAVSIVGRIYN